MLQLQPRLHLAPETALGLECPPVTDAERAALPCGGGSLPTASSHWMQGCLGGGKAVGEAALR